MKGKFDEIISNSSTLILPELSVLYTWNIACGDKKCCVNTITIYRHTHACSHTIAGGYKSHTHHSCYIFLYGDGIHLRVDPLWQTQQTWEGSHQHVLTEAKGRTKHNNFWTDRISTYTLVASTATVLTLLLCLSVLFLDDGSLACDKSLNSASLICICMIAACERKISMRCEHEHTHTHTHTHL